MENGSSISSIQMARASSTWSSRTSRNPAALTSPLLTRRRQSSATFRWGAVEDSDIVIPSEIKEPAVCQSGQENGWPILSRSLRQGGKLQIEISDTHKPTVQNRRTFLKSSLA